MTILGFAVIPPSAEEDAGFVLSMIRRTLFCVLGQAPSSLESGRSDTGCTAIKL